MKMKNMNLKKDSEYCDNYSEINSRYNHCPSASPSTGKCVNFSTYNKINECINDSSNNSCDSNNSKEEEHLWDFDTSLIERDPISGTKFGKESSTVHSFSDCSDEDENSDDWSNKRVELWDTRDTITWLVDAGTRLGHSYAKMPIELAMPGVELIRLSRKQFLGYDKDFGGQLYDLLHKETNSKSIVPSFQKLGLGFDDEVGTNSSDNAALKDSTKSRETKRRGRPPKKGNGCSKKTPTGPKLWEFVRSLLHDRKYCPSWIRWENYEEKTFRFIENHAISRLWGERKENQFKPMNFEKFTRAMRYYYKKHIFEIVPKKRLIYKFGEKATGLETNNPNFERDEENA